MSSLEEIIFCDSSCGVNASDALGYDVPCTCGAEKTRSRVEAYIQSQIEEARIDEVEKLHEWWDTHDIRNYKGQRLATLKASNKGSEE